MHKTSYDIRGAFVGSGTSAALRAVAHLTQKIAHDFQTPFSTLKLVVHQMKMGKLHTSGHELIVKHVENVCRHADGLIEELLMLHDPSALRFELVSLQEIVSSVWKIVNFNYSHKNLRLKLMYHHAHDLNVDTTKVRRLFLNLLKNAVEIMPDDADELWVISRELSMGEAAFIEVTLGNKGTFVPEEQQVQIFDSFYSYGQTTGTGLGLAICSDVVAAHGGRIICRSDRDTGTEFIFTLPCAPPR